MRVTQGMISQNSLRNISKSYEKLSKINEQAQTGKRFTKTSDDPVAAVKAFNIVLPCSEMNNIKIT